MTKQTRCDFELTDENGHLTAKFLPEGGTQTGDMFYAYLLKGGKVHQRSSNWTPSSTFHWNLSESGLYSVQGHIKRNGINTVSSSYPVLHLSREDQIGFEEFASSTCTPPNTDDVFRASYPYADFVLMSSRANINAAERTRLFADRHGLISHGDGASCLLTSDDALKTASDCSFLFSGSCFLKGRLAFGSRDLTTIDVVLNQEPTGSYTYVATDGAAGGYICGSDYFGIEKLFYIQSGDVAVASNNYHLLLLLARDLDVPLAVDGRKAEATLSFATLQPLHQNLTHNMDVSPACVAPVDKVVRVRRGRIDLVDTTLTRSLSGSAPYDGAKYEDLLLMAKEEILGNVQAVLEHPSFEHVVTDLSGGMDSRLVFNAITHFPQHSHRVRINSQYSQAEPDDHVVAQEITSLYDYEFDDLEREKFALPESVMGGLHWSYNLGSYYSYTPLPSGTRIPNSARLNGFYGEICARPYYSRKLFGTDLDVETAEEFSARYFAKYRSMAIIPSRSSIDSLQEIFRSALDSIPGRSALEKLDNHYLYFRNGLHCADRFRSWVSCPEFGPIQSKALFSAKTMSYHAFRGAKPQFDIINLLNPAVASLRYQSAFDNTDKESIHEKHGIMGEPWSRRLRIEPRDVSPEWAAAKDRIKQTVRPDDRASFAEFVERYRSFESRSAELALTCLNVLCREGFFGNRQTVKSIWLIISGRSDFPRSVRWSVINRLVSLYTQFRICHLIS